MTRGTRADAFDHSAFKQLAETCAQYSGRVDARACGRCQECVADRNAKYLRERGIPESDLAPIEKIALKRARERADLDVLAALKNAADEKRRQDDVSAKMKDAIGMAENPGTRRSSDDRYSVCNLCGAIEDGNLTCWACVERWPARGVTRADDPGYRELLARNRARTPETPAGAEEVSAFAARLAGRPPRPFEPDQKRIDAGEYVRAAGDAICGFCKLPLWKHPDVRGYEWLRRRCDGTFVKL